MITGQSYKLGDFDLNLLILQRFVLILYHISMD